MSEIRSYRRVFDLERRIYRIDRLRLNPTGVPVRGVLYFLLALIPALLLAQLPVVGGLAGAMPWYLRSVLLPGALAALLTVVRVEGRPFHLAAPALLGSLLGPRCSSGFRARAPLGERWPPPGLLILPDGSASRVRRLCFVGPGAVRVSVEHELRQARGMPVAGIAPATRAPDLRITAPAGARRLSRGRIIELSAGTRVLLGPASAGRRR
jgi:hypothetical protein